jgi:protein-tyrosine phosphatase
MTTLTTRDLDGVHNFRALAPYPLKGGGHIRPGMVYRAGALDLMTEADCAYLSDVAGIATVLDLRHADELAIWPIEHALQDRVAPLSLFPEAVSQEGLIAELNGLYGMGPSPQRYLHYLAIGGPQFAQAFELLSRAETYPVLVHCTAGKDRTGVLLGLLMDLLGAHDEDIATEYGLSDESIPRLIAYLESTGRVLEGTREEITARLSTPPERMAGFITLMREKYGDAESYLRGQGVSPTALDRVRELLIAH